MNERSFLDDRYAPEPWRRASDRTNAYSRQQGDRRPSSERLAVVRRSRAGARLLAAPDGMQWLVYELDLRAYRDGASLVFESECVVRRIRTFPATWRELSDTKLADLCRDR